MFRAPQKMQFAPPCTDCLVNHVLRTGSSPDLHREMRIKPAHVKEDSFAVDQCVIGGGSDNARQAYHLQAHKARPM